MYNSCEHFYISIVIIYFHRSLFADDDEESLFAFETSSVLSDWFVRLETPQNQRKKFHMNDRNRASLKDEALNR